MDDKILKIINNKIIFSKDSRAVENPKHLQKMFFYFIHQENLLLNQQLSKRLIQKLLIFAKKFQEIYYIEIDETDEINELFYGKHRLWFKILNKSFEDNIEIIGQPIGFFVIDPDNFNMYISTYTVQNKGKKREEQLHAKKQEGRQENFLHMPGEA